MSSSRELAMDWLSPTSQTPSAIVSAVMCPGSRPPCAGRRMRGRARRSHRCGPRVGYSRENNHFVASRPGRISPRNERAVLQPFRSLTGFSRAQIPRNGCGRPCRTDSLPQKSAWTPTATKMRMLAAPIRPTGPHRAHHPVAPAYRSANRARHPLVPAYRRVPTRSRRRTGAPPPDRAGVQAPTADRAGPRAPARAGPHASGVRPHRS